MGYLDPFFGKVFLNGAPVPLAGGFNFVSPYTIAITQDEDGNDVLTLGFDESSIEATLAVPEDPGDDFRVPYASAGDVVYNPYLKAASGGLQLNGAAPNGSALTIPHGHDFLSAMLDGGGFATLISWGLTTDAALWGSPDVTSNTYRAKAGGYFSWEIDSSEVGRIDEGALTLDLALVLSETEIGVSGGVLSAAAEDLEYRLGPFEIRGDTALTSINLGSGDFVGFRHRTTAATAVSITVPADTSGIPVESVINITQAGDGQITLVASGTTLNTPETLKTRKKWSTISLYKVSATVWDVTGDLELAP